MFSLGETTNWVPPELEHLPDKHPQRVVFEVEAATAGDYVDATIAAQTAAEGDSPTDLDRPLFGFQLVARSIRAIHKLGVKGRLVTWGDMDITAKVRVIRSVPFSWFNGLRDLAMAISAITEEEER